MDKFNRLLLQKSIQNTTCQLYTAMSRLVRLYASNLLKPECIVAVGNDLSKLNLATRNQLANENCGLGDATTWTYLDLWMEEELDPQPYYKAQFLCGLFTENAEKISIWRFYSQRFGNH